MCTHIYAIIFEHNVMNSVHLPVWMISPVEGKQRVLVAGMTWLCSCSVGFKSTLLE